MAAAKPTAGACPPRSHGNTPYGTRGACPLCGRGRCRGKASGGGRCKQFPIRGGAVCGTHGGRAPQVKAAAEKRVQEEKAEAEARKLLGLTDAPAVDYREALVSELRVWSAITGWYRREISALERLTEQSKRGETGQALVVLHDQASQHLLRVIRACHEARIDQQMLDLAQAHADQTDRLIHALIRQLGLDPQAPEVRQAVRASLTLIEGGAA